MFIIPVGATTISIRETVATRNYLGKSLPTHWNPLPHPHFHSSSKWPWGPVSPTAVKNLRGEYYLNGHWLIDFSMAKPIAGTVLYYQRGAEGDNVPETIIGRGPTTEPLVVEVRWKNCSDPLAVVILSFFKTASSSLIEITFLYYLVCATLLSLFSFTPSLTVKVLGSRCRTRCFSSEVSAFTDVRLSVPQIISEEANQGVDYEYFLPHAPSRDGYYWSFGSWSTCSRECGSGQSLFLSKNVFIVDRTQYAI